MTGPGESFRVLLTTAGSTEEGATIARALVERRLAACVNIIDPVRSIYRWEGTVHDDREILLVIKTTAAAFPDLERVVRELHSYDCPELLQLPVSGGEARYLAWLDGQIG
jgi:periplasmic divalent cation tolerance protein